MFNVDKSPSPPSERRVGEQKKDPSLRENQVQYTKEFEAIAEQKYQLFVIRSVKRGEHLNDDKVGSPVNAALDRAEKSGLFSKGEIEYLRTKLNSPEAKEAEVLHRFSLNIVRQLEKDKMDATAAVIAGKEREGDGGVNVTLEDVLKEARSSGQFSREEIQLIEEKANSPEVQERLRGIQRQIDTMQKLEEEHRERLENLLDSRRSTFPDLSTLPNS